MVRTRTAARLIWIPAFAIFALVFAGLPLFGLYLIDGEAGRIMRITPVREAATELSRSTTALRTSVRQYELTGSGGSPPDPAEAMEVQAHIDAVYADAMDLTLAAPTEPRLEGPANDLVAATEIYVDSLDPMLAGIANSSLSMQVANDANLAYAERSNLAAAFSAAESELTADRFSSLRRRQLVSLVLSSAPAMAIVVALAVVGFRQMSRLRGRLEVAEQTSEDREQMVNLASHELRNPLAIISLSAELLKHQADETGDESLADSAQEVRVAALRADALVAELLDLSRLDANRLRLKLEPKALTPILKGAIDVTAQYRGEREVEISMGDASRDLVVADGARLQIVLRNLIDNAFKYSEAGTPVSVDIESRGDHTEIDVYDHGPGVPKGESDAVFSRFSRLEQTSHVSGVGIGMFLSRELARRMGGDLRAFDGEARGHFRLTLSAPPPTKVFRG